LGVGFAVVACCGTGRPAGAETAPTVEDLQQQFFESRVRPLLSTKCQECHGDGIAEAGLRLDSRKALIRGADSGPVVVPGKANESRLLAVVRHADDIAMPPEGKLSDDEISVLETWISAGAPWSGPGGDDDTSAPAAGPSMTDWRPG
jgi:cytochrome c5